MTRTGSVGLDVRIVDDGAELRGGLVDERLLKWLGSDITITGAGSETYTFPAATDTIVGRISTDTLQNKTLVSAVLNTALSGTAVLNEDDMASDSDTKIATQQSIKAYVDSEFAGFAHVDLDDMPSATVSDHDGRYYTEVELSGTGGADFIGIAILDTPTYDSLQDLINITQSAGYVSGGEITDNENGTVAVASGQGFIKTANSAVGATVSFDWSTDASVSLDDDVLNYIYVDYNSGTPLITSTTSFASLNQHTQFVIGIVFRKGTEAEIVASSGVRVSDFIIDDWHRLEHRGIERMSGGLVSESGTRGIAVTASVYYRGNSEIAPGSQSNFITVWRDGGTGWTYTTGQTQLTNSLYDDGDGTPGTLSAAKYGVYWVYQCLEGDIYVQYGQVQNYNLAQAQLASAPTPPNYLASFAYLIAKIIVLNGGTNFIEVENRSGEQFTVTVPSNHNELTGLQGGQADQYYHLTAAELSAIGDNTTHSTSAGTDHSDVGLANTHRGLTNNPHAVTQTQVGLANLSNDAQLKIASNLSDLNSASTARSNLGLGTAAVEDVGTGAGNVPQLDAGGKLLESIIPSLAVSEYLGNFTDTTAALADGGVQASERGDWFTVNTSGGLTYIVTTDDPTTTGDITLLKTPTAAVASVNGHTGIVVLDPDDLDDTATTNKFTTAGDISKLAGIEEGATTDQSGSEIKIAYEGEADTNAYDDAAVLKLSGIDAGADVTADNAPKAHTASHTNGTDDIQDATAAQKGVATAAQITKLDAIEASADVTDADNVNSAGATMNADTDVSSNGYVLDEDDLVTDSNTKVATQQSIKKYVDDRLAGAGTDPFLLMGA